MDGDRVLTLVEAHLLSVLGQDSGRAGVSFLGSERVDVLRFGSDNLERQSLRMTRKHVPFQKAGNAIP